MGVKWRTLYHNWDGHECYADGYQKTIRYRGNYGYGWHTTESNTHHWFCPRCKGWNRESDTSCIGCNFDRTGCFITTATLLSLDKDDNCYELQLARKFRDTFMKEKYPELVQQYYQIAPQIVDAINNLPEKQIVYKEIWENYLKQFVVLIESSQFEATKTLYQKMVEDLSTRVLV